MSFQNYPDYHDWALRHVAKAQKRRDRFKLAMRLPERGGPSIDREERVEERIPGICVFEIWLRDAVVRGHRMPRGKDGSILAAESS